MTAGAALKGPRWLPRYSARRAVTDPDRNVRAPKPGGRSSPLLRHINAHKEIIMLKDSSIMAVLPAKDINRAKDFYRDKLGIEPSESMEEGSVMYRCGNGTG